MDDPITRPAFAAVRAYLQQADAEPGAAEAHGLLCGMLCAHAAIGPGPWIEQVLGPGHGGQALPEVLDAIYRSTRVELTDGELAFHPLLPEDDEPLPVRARALGRWCEGFLAGLGLAGSPGDAAQTGEVGEFLRDVAEITRIGLEPAADEEDESAYAEIVEYLRVGVLLTYETLNHAPDGSAGTIH